MSQRLHAAKSCYPEAWENQTSGIALNRFKHFAATNERSYKERGGYILISFLSACNNVGYHYSFKRLLCWVYHRCSRPYSVKQPLYPPRHPSVCVLAYFEFPVGSWEKLRLKKFATFIRSIWSIFVCLPPK